MKNKYFFLVLFFGTVYFQACKPRGMQQAVTSDAASKVYVAPGTHDEFYNFVYGGFSGQMSVYGLPSGRLLRVIPVFKKKKEKFFFHRG